MKKNTIYKILKLFKITLLASCSFYSKPNDKEATNELQPNHIELNKTSITKEGNLKKILNLGQKEPSNYGKENVIQKITQRFNENEKLINKIGPNIEIFAQKINTDVQKIEPINQFEINKNTFPEKQDDNIDAILENNLFRRLFYSSLEYDENKIKRLITILAQASSSNGDHYRVIGLIFWTGFKIQESFEKAVNLLTKDEQRRLMFNFKTKTVKDVQENFEKLIQERNAWITIVENIISDYDKYAGIRADGIVLKEFIKNGYEHKFNPNKSMQILMDIETLLKACCDHIHY
ncbi:complement regulator-acquiring protein (plasmid) [Borreliella valaisiana]|uniref:complement regulator-acquiring protein n=1 Tax=Borreliella valaisiana TaxID=62088 RepID=UPI002738084D|nr:complement regulator-acquiring protein [Borreliella valaisiana]WKC76668.1 complement regulator-acquiring protein [Borreliella valaisiana]WLN25720.1 complement regulator-acquiring protein [Borreliella valaisiana]WVN14683.1 complement regulator-acquiring protein [Borreliella valaisiana]